MQDIPTTTAPVSLNADLIIAVVLLVLFGIVWWRRSLAAVASLVMIASAYIVNKGSPFINEWLQFEQSGSMAGTQALTSLRLAIVLALSIFVLVILRHIASRVPILLRAGSAALFALLLFWYVSVALRDSIGSFIFDQSDIYVVVERAYPVLLLLALVLSLLELWFVRSSSGKARTKK